MNCKPFGDPGNIYTLITSALAYAVVNSSRSTTPRLILVNTGNVRFDLHQGPFTFDDTFIVSPFKNTFKYLQDVPHTHASQILGILNAGPNFRRKRDLSYSDFNFQNLLGQGELDSCEDNASPDVHGLKLSARMPHPYTPKVKRVVAVSPGHITNDDFGANGDDTIHSRIPYYDQPHAVQANASFPTDGTMPKTVDFVFLDYLAPRVLNALEKTGVKYNRSNVQDYLPPTFTTNKFLSVYAKAKWQTGVSSCPVGSGFLS